MVNILEGVPPPKNIQPKGADGANLPTDQLTTYKDDGLPVDVETEVSQRDLSELSRAEEGFEDYDRS